jgi:hypothetical protein
MQTQINLLVVLTILFIHWIADFVCQTDKMAQGKSKNWTDLLNHTVIYSTIWLLPIAALFSMNHKITTFHDAMIPFAFVGITFICHTIQDYITSRINSKLWDDKKIHWFFVSIGFDQLLHFIQLILTYQILKSC